MKLTSTASAAGLLPFQLNASFKFLNNSFNCDFSNRNFIGVSGTFTSIGSMYLNQIKYNEDEIDKIDISYESIHNLYENLKLQNFSISFILEGNCNSLSIKTV